MTENFKSRAEAVSNRITARKLLLINWSRFQYMTFEMSGSTLITGVNGTGKSTVMDAFTYLLTGNTKFNLAAKDRDRSIKAYVRGDTRSNGASRFLRSGSVISYIAAEFYNPTEGKPLVVGVCIESPGDADPAVSRWFIFRETRLSDLHLRDLNEKTGNMAVVPRTKLTVRGSRPKAAAFLNKTSGIPQLLRALGIRTDYRRYQSKLTKMMAFNPENNIDRFIQESVLEDDPVNSLGEIREYRAQYGKVKDIYDNMLEGRRQLEDIEKAAVLYERRRDSLKIHELMLLYQEMKQIQKEKEDTLYRIRGLKQRKRTLEARTPQIERSENEALERLTKARSSDLLQGVSGTIDRLKTQAESLKRDIRDEESKLADIIRLKKQILASFKWGNYSVPTKDQEKEILKGLEREDIPAEDKTDAFLHYMDAARAQTDLLTAEQTHLSDAVKEEEENRNRLLSEQKALEANQIIYEQKALDARELIQKELEKQGIRTDVFLFAELVKDIRDPKWRRAIETFLGGKRFYLITDERYTGDVLNILNERNLYWAHAVVTDRLPDKLDETREGSAAEQLVIANRAARRYANYLLGGIHLCDSVDQLHDHPLGGLMQNGMLAKSYAVTKMDMRRTRICLGRDAIDIQKKEVKKQLEESDKKLDELRKLLEPVQSYVQSLMKMNLDAGAYDFEAPKTIVRYQTDLRALEENIQKIQNTPEFLAALQEQQDAQKAYDKCKSERDAHVAAISECRTAVTEQEKNLDRAEANEKECEDRYREQKETEPDLERPMLEEYQKLTIRNGSLVGIQEKTVSKQRTDLQNIIEPALRREQQKYLKIIGRMDEYEIMTGPSQIPFYRLEYSNLKNVKIDEARQQLEAKTQQLESAFMNDFVAELKEKMDRAGQEMDSINRELKQTPFGMDTYRFEMKPRSDRSAFFNIIKRLDDYKDSPELMMAMEQGNTQLDHDIQEFMNVILSDEEEQEYTDYRSYFNYDMRIISRQGQDNIEADLSKKQGSASGGEKQTPYFIILAASLMQCYPRDVCCERLAFIDEAFSALSRERIEQMVKYLEENHFQVIYAAPPEKIDSIGSHIDTTVSLVTKGRYTFAIEGMRLA